MNKKLKSRRLLEYSAEIILILFFFIWLPISWVQAAEDVIFRSLGDEPLKDGSKTEDGESG